MSCSPKTQSRLRNAGRSYRGQAEPDKQGEQEARRDGQRHAHELQRSPRSIVRSRKHPSPGKRISLAEEEEGRRSQLQVPDQAWRRPHAQDLQDVRPNRPDRFEFGEFDL